jgi:hypothetical protein
MRRDSILLRLDTWVLQAGGDWARKVVEGVLFWEKILNKKVEQVKKVEKVEKVERLGKVEKVGKG